ncbi:MAG TPA: hypothetical protein VML54_12900 [Candidatus Limnocylindrales bacterium]|nr:hypothetical protein [Candidatus Limnocylindrales bacterium]
MSLAAQHLVLGLDALIHNDAGEPVLPSTHDDWADWVAASKTRNWVIGDPLLDWLHLHGDGKSFERDDELPGYDPRCDFTAFILRQGRRFEVAAVDHLRTRTDVVTIARDAADTMSLEKALETVEAMREGVPVIHQGVLRDPEHRVFGAPDLLVRSDVLRELFPGSFDPDQARLSAPGLGGGPWHYRVVDVKFTTLRLLAGGDLGNSRSASAYKIQLFLYDRALARIQGTGRLASYLIGRGWEHRLDGMTRRGAGALERLGPFAAIGTLANGAEPARVAGEACAWIRRVRREGAGWNVLPRPSRPELYPNLANTQDGPWHAAKRRIAEELEDPTLLWQVGVSCRESALRQGVSSWLDPACTPDLLGVKESHRPTLAAILDVNRSANGPPVRPARVRAAGKEWRAEPALEFYVDFETVNDLWDDFSRFPERGVPPLIFLIGCGHLEDGEWRFERFLAEALSEEAEARVIDGWLAHMEAVQRRVDPGGGSPLVIHWSHAETTHYEKAYNSARRRHPDRAWPSPCWFDLLRRVFHAEPVVVRGAFGFGLKEVARALHEHRLIETLWEGNSLDGLGAMVGAWWCYEEALRRGRPVSELDLMQEIVRYNELDCRVLGEILRYLRRIC